MNNVHQPNSLKVIAGIVSGLSLRDLDQPGGFSMRPTNIDNESVQANRKLFAEKLGFYPTRLAVANQDHTGEVDEVVDAYDADSAAKADALITKKPGWLLGVTIADCVGLLFYDPRNKAIGVAHSGRKGTISTIAANTLARMIDGYATDPAEVMVYLSPCPDALEYPLDLETAKSCNPRYLSPAPNPAEVYYDNRQAVYDQLIAAGVKEEHIEVDRRSTISDSQFHSYRRDHDQAGRMLLAIGLR